MGIPQNLGTFAAALNTSGQSEINASTTGTLTVPRGGTGASSLSGILKGNGASAFTVAAAADILSAIGTTPVPNGGTGVSTLPVGALVVGNGTSPVTTLVGTSVNQVPTWNGTNWVPGVNTIAHGYQLFTTAGTFTVPAGVSSLNVACFGGGGGGASLTSGGLWAGGPGAGVYVVINGLASGTAIPVTIGAGGAGGLESGGAARNGATGGTTTFGSYITCFGGTGGNYPGGAGIKGSYSLGATVSLLSKNAGFLFGGGTGDYGYREYGTDPTSYEIYSGGGGGGLNGGNSGNGPGKEPTLRPEKGGLAYGPGNNGVDGVTTNFNGGNGGAGGVIVWW